MNKFDEMFDFVVVGSGAGSMCAALFLRTLNKRVLILEKDIYVGGTTARSGGVMWIPNNPFLKRDGIEDSEEKAMQYLDALAADHPPAPGNTPDRRRTYVQQAPKMIEFLLSQGIVIDRTYKWPDYYDDKPGGMKAGRSVASKYFNVNELGAWKDRLRPGFMAMPATMEELLELPFYKKSWQSKKTFIKLIGRMIAAKLTGKHFTSAGAALQGRMLQAALARQVDIRPESPVTELIVEDGTVTGVVTEKDGKPWRVGSTMGVLINAGGFARNKAMREQYQPGTSPEWSSTAPCDTGEMLQELMRVGAATAQLEEMVGNQCTLPPGTKYEDIKQGIQSVTAKPHAILVDQTGVRFMSEGGSYMGYCKGMLERNREVPAIPSWAVFDSSFLRNYMIAGTWPGTKKPKSWYDEGYLKKADTLEDLAKIIGVEAATLKNTVDRFNGFCDKGRDEDFHRGERQYDLWLGDPTKTGIAKTLGKIETGPYYAVETFPGDVGTYGGVVTDEYARVLKEDGSIIKGLYATGVTTASVMGRSYAGAGASVGPSLTFGFVAAQHAAGTIG